MESITIAVQSEEFETINVELTKEEVTALYKLRKELTLKVEELEKKLATVESDKKYADVRNTELTREKQEASVLLTALGVPEKTENEESYYRKDISTAGRIALYISQRA